MPDINRITALQSFPNAVPEQDSDGRELDEQVNLRYEQLSRLTELSLLPFDSPPVRQVSRKRLARAAAKPATCRPVTASSHKKAPAKMGSTTARRKEVSVGAESIRVSAYVIVNIEAIKNSPVMMPTCRTCQPNFRSPLRAK